MVQQAAGATHYNVSAFKILNLGIDSHPAIDNGFQTGFAAKILIEL